MGPFSSLLMAASLLVSSGAAPVAELSFQGLNDPGCFSKSELQDAVAARLGYSPWRPQAAQKYRVELIKNGVLYYGRVVLEEAGQELARRETPRVSACQAVNEALSLSIAISIDPLGGGKPKETEPAETPQAVTPPPPPPEKTNAIQLHHQLGLASVLSLGTAPSPALGLKGYYRLGLEKLSMGIEGRIDLPGRSNVSPEAEVESSLALVSLLPCYQAIDSLNLCLSIDAGIMRVKGSGFEEARQDTVFYSQLGFQLGYSWYFQSNLSVQAGVGLNAALTRVSLVDSQTELLLWSASEITGQGYLGLGFDL